MTHKNEPPDMGSVYRNTKAALVRRVSRFFSNSHDVEDVVQEAFVKVIAAQRDREIQSPEAYLHRTARNVALSRLSKNEYKLTHTTDGVLPKSDLLLVDDLEKQFEARENFELFCRAVRSLPVKCRRAFVLCRVYGFSQKEVAEYMGISLKGVEAHLTRATSRCLALIKAEQSRKAPRRISDLRNG